MQLSDLISAVRENLQDASGVRWSDALITRYLNEGQKVVAPFSYSLSFWEIPFSAAQDYATRSATLLMPVHVTFRVGDSEWELVRRSGMPNSPVSTQGDPTTAFFLTNEIHLRPVPADAGTLRISGTQRPADMVSSSDTPGLTDSDDVLMAYATWRCLAADVDPAAFSWKELFEQLRREWMVFDSMRNPQRSEARSDWWW